MSDEQDLFAQLDGLTNAEKITLAIDNEYIEQSKNETIYKERKKAREKEFYIPRDNLEEGLRKVLLQLADTPTMEGINDDLMKDLRTNSHSVNLQLRKYRGTSGLCQNCIAMFKEGTVSFTNKNIVKEGSKAKKCIGCRTNNVFANVKISDEHRILPPNLNTAEENAMDLRMKRRREQMDDKKTEESYNKASSEYKKVAEPKTGYIRAGELKSAMRTLHATMSEGLISVTEYGNAIKVLEDIVAKIVTTYKLAKVCEDCVDKLPANSTTRIDRLGINKKFHCSVCVLKDAKFGVSFVNGIED